MAATANERLGRVSGEAFNRLRSDYQQFLEAYEKPTQIYRFLKARQSLKPLFLHRNLSYMRHRDSYKRKKRIKRLLVNDLIKHTRDEKPDLATEIKSDNYLQIRFSCLEKGIDFEELLDSAVDSTPNNKKSTSETEGLPRKHENHQLEVEVVLCRFKQPVAETLMEAPRIQPYSYSTLGKFVLDYHHDKKAVNELNCRSAHRSNRNLTLSIPESELTWKGGSRSAGTQLLVFRASRWLGSTCKPETAKKTVSELHSSSSSTFTASPFCTPSSSSSSTSTIKKTARKTVALELNRITPVGLARIHSHGVSSSSSTHHSHDITIATDSSKHRQKSDRPLAVVVDSQQNFRRNGSLAPLENAAFSPSLLIKKVNGHDLAVGNSVTALGGKSSNRQSRSSCNHKQQQEEEGTFEDTGYSESDSDHNSGTGMSLASSKKRPATKEIGVVTDLCGIDSVLDLSPAISKTTTNNLASGRKGSANLRLSLQPTPSLKEGCTDRCTSPGFPLKQPPFRNGGFNGFTFNGYTNPDVLRLRAGPNVYQKHKKKKKKVLSLLQRQRLQQIKTMLASDLSNVQFEEEAACVPHKDPETGEIRPFGEIQGGNLYNVSDRDNGGGNGRSGDVPFTISIPRTLLDSSVLNESDSDGMEYVDTEEGLVGDDSAQMPSDVDGRKDGTGGDGGGNNVLSQLKNPSTTTSSSSTYRRRSEIQLLLDGDKPPSERISASEVPIFTAEDVSSRNNRASGGGGGSGAWGGASSGSSGQLNKSWLDSSTRKITPVEHFDYSYVSLNQKITGIINSSSSNTSGVNSATSSASNRKRNIRESESPLSASLSSVPPKKQVKVNSGSSGGTAEENHHSRERSSSALPECVGGCNYPTVLSPTESPAQDTSLTENSSTVCGEGTKDKIKQESDNARRGGTDDGDTLFRPDEVFASELVVFDSRGDCLLKEGEYSIIMQRCSKKEAAAGESSELLTFPPLTWNSVFGGCTNTKKSENSQFQNIMLRFSLCWTQGPPQHRLCSEFDTALDFKKIRETYFPPQSPSPAPPPLPVSTSRPHPTPADPPLALQVNSPSSSLSELDRMSDTPTPHVPSTLAGNTCVQEFTNNPTGEAKDLVWYSSFPNALPASTSVTPQPSLPSNNYSSYSAQSKLVFNFLYNNNTVQRTESHGDMRCPWCHLHCERLYSLLKHMSLNHSRFHYTYTPNESGPNVVDVHVNKMYDAVPSISERDPGERSDISFLQKKRGPTKRIPCTAVLVERHAETDEDLSEFLNDNSWKRGYITNRIYHHSRSSLPMLPEELENESEEDEKSLEWQIISSHKMIDEFTDVNKGEKELMKLWNHFAMQNKLIASKQIPNACLAFAREKRQDLIDKGIVQNFMTHLIALCDMALISPTVLKDSMTIVYADKTS